MGAQCKMVRVFWSPGGCLHSVGIHPWDGDPATEGGAALGIIRPGALRQLRKGQGVPRVSLPPADKHTAGIDPHKYPRLAVSKRVCVYESTGEDAGAFWPPSKEQKAP